MNYSAALKYNVDQATKLGWEPDWFGCDSFDTDLVDAIVLFQKEYGLTADGYCGPSTYRRKYTERMSDMEEVKHEVESKSGNVLIYGGEPIPINWPKVVLWNEEGGLKTAEGHYTNMIGKEKREIKMFVNHWDVCLSSKSCSSVLNAAGRQASIHLMIDNDGTIYQSLDLQNVAWHAGGRSWNYASIGVEISNAYYTKYQDWYVRNGYGERPLAQGSVNGNELEVHLDFYDIQKDAARAIWECMHNAFGLPYEAPPVDGLYQPARDCDFRGFVHHYNLSSKKIDCGGWNIREELDKLKGGNT
jgi:hypothetical protein